MSAFDQIYLHPTADNYCKKQIVGTPKFEL